MAVAADAAPDAAPGYPDGWGTSPRRAPTVTKPLTFEDVVPMTEAPPEGTVYWLVYPISADGVASFNWDNTDIFDINVLRHRMAYLDREDALIAARHIYGLKGGEL